MEGDLSYRISLPSGIIECNTLILSEKVGQWCRLPYPNHPKGCPKYCKGPTCPPAAPHISTVVDMKKPIYFAFGDFDLAEHMAKMKLKYPDWSELQCRCVLYWQAKSRNLMRYKAKLAKYLTGANISIECPEGIGVYVYATARKNGLKREKIKNSRTCHHVALIGSRR